MANTNLFFFPYGNNPQCAALRIFKVKSSYLVSGIYMPIQIARNILGRGGFAPHTMNEAEKSRKRWRPPR
jgi:hypothetical protein